MNRKEFDKTLRQILVECHDYSSKRARCIGEAHDFVKRNDLGCVDTLMAVCEETLKCLTGRGLYQGLEQWKVKNLCHFTIEALGNLAQSRQKRRIRNFLRRILHQYRTHRLIRIRMLALEAKSQLFWSDGRSFNQALKAKY